MINRLSRGVTCRLFVWSLSRNANATNGAPSVGACIGEARQLGIKKIFVLTYVPDFFDRLGFKPVDKSTLPHKVWADCVNCVKFPDCDEDAMMLALSG